MKHDLVTMGTVTSCGACGQTGASSGPWQLEDCLGPITVESVQAKLDAGAREYTRAEMKDLLIAVKDHTGDRHKALALLDPYHTVAEVQDRDIQSIMLKAMKAYPELAATLLMDKPETTGLKMDAPPMPGAINVTNVNVTNVNGPASITDNDEPEHVKQSRAWALECSRSQVEHHGHHNVGLQDARYWFKRGWEAKGNAK